MKLQQKTLEKLRNLITHETEYRSGSALISFFNSLGRNDTYGQGFPSRKKYVDINLASMNGNAQLVRCIKQLLSPVNFVARIADLDKLITDFNKYLFFDGWEIIRESRGVRLAKTASIDIELTEDDTEVKEDDFLKREFGELPIEELGLDGAITETLNLRFEEIKKCLSAKAPLSVIFLCGSSLEGILLGIAFKHPREFNQANASPKDKTGKSLQFHLWTLSNYIDVACEVGFLTEDVKKYSHSLRDFRNYIHPYEQVDAKFNPDEHTAKISWQVLKAVLFRLSKLAQCTSNQ